MIASEACHHLGIPTTRAAALVGKASRLQGVYETTYSRFGDGRAVLRSSIREMIASEACHHLGIPTTRAAALVVSDDHKVWRDKSYMGHARQERAAIVARVAPAWYRIGSLEILLKRREPQLMTRLVDHVIQHYFPEIDSTDEDKYLKWFTEVAHRNLDLVAKWQGFGFAHGVLNTDNVSLLGLTLDYGPYGFMDYYYPRMIPNTTDDLGRYCYKNQPEIMLWNLEKFAECVEPLLTDEQKEKFKDIRGTLEDYIKRKVLETFIHKLGLEEVKEGDDILVQDLLEVMQTATADYTATFRQLAKVDPSDLVNTSSPHWSLNKLSEAKPWPAWVEKYKARVKLENVAEEVRRKRMLAVNPAYVPRNWMLQEAIADAEKNDFEKVRFLLKIFENPYEENEEADNRGYSSLPPTWSYGLKINCSS
ncbi:protein adenylyltransferase SelO-like [Ostrinia nubilalis]|uniref:protein adenylyltransferase SelO-like n=1 Tax=Ostrinia nubilalis TaxID=29057 RepID=UPI003082283E